MTSTDEAALKLLADGRLIKLKGLTGQLPWRATDRFANEIASFVTSTREAALRDAR